MARPGVRGWHALPFVLPFLLLFAVLTVWPVLFNGWLAFHDYFIHSGNTAWNGMANFVGLARDEIYFPQALGNSLLFLLTVPVLQVLGLGLALLVMPQRPLMVFFRALLYVPVIIAVSIAAIVFSVVLQADGPVNWLLASMSGTAMTAWPDWLNDERYARYVALVFYCWKHAGFYMVLYLAGLQQVPRELLDNARLDGANAWQRLRHVQLPCLQPVILLCTVLATIGALRAFQEVIVLTGGGNGTLTLPMYAYYSAFSGQNFGAAAAVAFLLVLVCLLIAAVQWRLLGERGMLRRGGW